MSLEYEIDQYIEKVKKTLLIQRNILIRDFISCYLPAINSSVFSEEEDESDCIVDSFYFTDFLRTKDEMGSAS